MNSLRRSILGAFLLSQLALVSLGCGDGGGGADAVTAPPDMSATPDPKTMMPGYNQMQEDVKKNGVNP